MGRALLSEIDMMLERFFSFAVAAIFEEVASYIKFSRSSGRFMCYDYIDFCIGFLVQPTDVCISCVTNIRHECPGAMLGLSASHKLFRAYC